MKVVSKWSNWLLMSREDTETQARASMKRFRSVASRTKGKIVKEGRGFSVYIKYEHLIRRW